MSHYSFQDKTFESYDLQKSKFLTPFQRQALIKNLPTNLQPEYRHRLEIMFLADMGTQTQNCEILGCDQKIAWGWIAVAQAVSANKWNERLIGRPVTINNQYLERLKKLVSYSPREYGYAFKCWITQWLSKYLATNIGIEISARHINRLPKQMGLSKERKFSCQKEIDQTKNVGMTICDLQFPSQPSFYWSFNLIAH